MAEYITKISYNQRLWKQFKKQSFARRSFKLLMGLLLIAFFSDFLANERPLYCKLDGKHYFPVIKEYAITIGWATREAQFVNKDWTEHDYESVIRTPIPYSANTQDIRNRGFVSPFDNQNVESWRWWHWLGTDQFGRDVAAGMIAGTRTAALVGFLSMLIASLIGVFLGALAGYFGDTRRKISRAGFWLNMAAIPFAVFYGFIARKFYREIALEEGTVFIELIKSLFWIALPFFAAYGLKLLLERINFFKKEVTIPVDSIVMRMIEIMRSVPGLLLLIVIVALFENPSLLNVIIIIGFIRWTGIASFLRAEILRIREMEYIQAARALGFSNWRIIINHILPNAITPVLIAITFGIASSVLLEAFLSFLGIGVAVGEVTWGSMLNIARRNFSAWWLAVFPGAAIFVTVTILNLIGDGLTKAMEESN